MMIEATLYSAAETANILRKALGPMRSWIDTLNDMRRPSKNTTVYGFQLLPVCRMHDGLAYRPVYASGDIAAFIKSVWEVAEEAEANVQPVGVKMAYDPEIHWKFQKFKPVSC